jgi:iron complex transport system substrate-binding protein
MRICSLLPGATEIVYALGAGNDLVGVSHECTYPEEVLKKPVLTGTKLNSELLTSKQIDDFIQKQVRTGHRIYFVDAELLRSLQPEILLTQEQCEVCAVEAGQACSVAGLLDPPPRVISLRALELADVFPDIETVAAATGRQPQGQALIASLRARLERVRQAVSAAPPLRVLVLGWIDPPMASGHWTKDMIIAAGGLDDMGIKGKTSRRIDVEEIRQYDPEIIIGAPCGLSMLRANAEMQQFVRAGYADDTSAMRTKRIYAVNPELFHRSGPRILEAIELLGSLIHPEKLPPAAPAWIVRVVP